MVNLVEKMKQVKELENNNVKVNVEFEPVMNGQNIVGIKQVISAEKQAKYNKLLHQHKAMVAQMNGQTLNSAVQSEILDKQM